MTKPTRHICMGVGSATCGRPGEELVFDPRLRRTVWHCKECALVARQRIALHTQHPVRKVRRP